MNLKILTFTIIIFRIYSGSCSDDVDQGLHINKLRAGNSNPEKRKLILGFLGSIFKPIIRGIANAVDPQPPPPPPPPQIIYQQGPDPATAPVVPTVATVPAPTTEPVKKEETKTDEKSKDSDSDKKEESESEESNVDEGLDDEDDDENHVEEDDDEED